MPSELTIRLSVFFGVFVLVALAEGFSPRRSLKESKAGRWFTNLSLVIIDTLVVRLLFPVLPIGIAEMAEARNWGGLHQVVLPPWFSFIATLIMLDLVIYLQHVSFHHVPLLWRLHRMHHTDLDLDVTSGSRFHPLEIIFSLLIKMGAVILLGAPAAAVLTFEVILNACAMFNHGNIRLPERMDGTLRLFLVTPDMHRVHHSTLLRETNSNYGFNVPWWDRLFSTYRAEPEKGQLGMMIGLNEFRDPHKLTLPYLLVQPFLLIDKVSMICFIVGVMVVTI